MTSITWPREASQALLYYMDTHLVEFATGSIRSRVGNPNAAAFLSDKFGPERSYTAKQVDTKLYKLYDRHSKTGTFREEFYRRGSLCLELQFLGESSDVPENNFAGSSSNNDSLGVLTTKTSLVSELPLRSRTSNYDLRESKSCEDCLEKEELIETLRSMLASPREPISSYGSLKPENLGPTDPVVAERLSETFRLLKITVLSYHNAGYGDGPFPDLETIEKKHPKLCTLLKQVYCIEADYDLLHAIAHLNIVSPTNEDLFQALLGAAIMNWALDSDFPDLLSDSKRDPVFRRYRSLIQERGRLKWKTYSDRLFKLNNILTYLCRWEHCNHQSPSGSHEITYSRTRVQRTAFTGESR